MEQVKSRIFVESLILQCQILFIILMSLLFKQHLKMKKLWFVVCFMMLEKLLLPVVMVKSVSIDLQIIHYYKDSDQEI